MYNTSLPVIFGVKKYADALWEVCNSRDVHVNLSTNLIQVRPSENEAVFQSLDKPDKTRVEKVRFKLVKIMIPFFLNLVCAF